MELSKNELILMGTLNILVGKQQALIEQLKLVNLGIQNVTNELIKEKAVLSIEHHDREELQG